MKLKNKSRLHHKLQTTDYNLVAQQTARRAPSATVRLKPPPPRRPRPSAAVLPALFARLQ